MRSEKWCSSIDVRNVPRPLGRRGAAWGAKMSIFLRVKCPTTSIRTIRDVKSTSLSIAIESSRQFFTCRVTQPIIGYKFFQTQIFDTSTQRTGLNEVSLESALTEFSFKRKTNNVAGMWLVLELILWDRVILPIVDIAPPIFGHWHLTYFWTLKDSAYLSNLPF